MVSSGTAASAEEPPGARAGVLASDAGSELGAGRLCFLRGLVGVFCAPRVSITTICAANSFGTVANNSKSRLRACRRVSTSVVQASTGNLMPVLG